MITDLTPEQVIAADTENRPAVSTDPVLEQKLRQAAKTSTFSMKLSFQDLEYLKRAASILELDWKDFFDRQIREKVLVRSGSIGQPLISGPSFSGKRISGPSI